MQILDRALLEVSYDFIMGILIHTYSEVSILYCQGFSKKNILYLLSKKLRQMFENLYCAYVLGRDKLGLSTVDKTDTMLWATTLQIHEVMADFFKYEI